MPQIVYLALGSNLGDRENNLMKATEMIAMMEGFEMIARSDIYISQPVDMDKSAPFFLNQVIKGQFDYTPLEMLNNLEAIEKKIGRKNKGDLKPRTIDIDILLWGDETIENERLTVPHKKMTKRAFVLVPLIQIDPDVTHPVTGKKLQHYIKKDETDMLILYKEYHRHHV